MSSTQPSDPRLARARALVLRHGWNPTAYQILNPGMRLWFAQRADAVAGHVERNGVRVVAGAPVCAPERLTAVVAELERDAAAHGNRVCYFCAGERLHGRLAHSTGHAAIRIGAQPAWAPERWPEMLAAHASLRAQLNRARNKGVRVREWPAERAHGSPVLHEVLEQWLEGRGMPPLHFLVEPETLHRLYDRRVLVAERAGERGASEVLGFLIASPVPARRGWLIEQLVRGHRAPNGTAELMIDAAVRRMIEQGDRYVTLGLAPLSRRAGPLAEGGSAWLRFLLGWLRAHVHRFYNFEGLEAFKAKFRPARWEPIYAIANEPRFRVRTLHAIAAAFSDGPPEWLIARAMGRAVRQEAEWAVRK